VVGTDARILCPEVIGRGSELAALDTYLGQVRAGAGRTIVIAGEAGIGKTALLRAFANRARDSHVRFLGGECNEVEARRPFGPFVQILRSARARFPPSESPEGARGRRSRQS